MPSRTVTKSAVISGNHSNTRAEVMASADLKEPWVPD